RRGPWSDRSALVAAMTTARMRAAEAIAARVVSIDQDRHPGPPLPGEPASGGSRAGPLAWRAGVSAAIGFLAAQTTAWLAPDAPWGLVLAFAASAAFGVLSFVGRRRKRAAAEWFGRAAMHPAWGVAVLLAVLYLVYMFVGVFGAETLVGLIEEDLFEGVVNPRLREAFAAIPWRPVRDLFVGPYGLLTMALTYAIAIVLPIVGTFFLAFSILEDSGYLPRLAVMVDRGFRLLGLNGKAVLPMVLGLGCGTMATLTTRILETRKERILATFLLALGIPCSAQLGVILAMFPMVGPALGAVWLGTIAATLVAAGLIARRVVPGDRSDFMMEIPPIRRPLPANIALKTAARLEWYLKEAVPLFALGTLVLFVLHETGALDHVHRAGRPIVVGLLGLPAEASEAFLMGFLRRDYGATILFDMASEGALAPAQIVVSMVTITLFIPCIANVFMIWKERGARVAAAVVAVVFPLAFLAGGAVRVLLEVLG
ncbi:MAG: nucleoside recognition domain-containing protein, partial [Myxococcota bacterium]|nr:nucleoside recognition domain-containing protein [Myxococcota bacterium]